MRLKPGYELEKLIPEGHGFRAIGFYIVIFCYFAFKFAFLARAFNFDETGNLYYVWSLRRLSPAVAGSLILFFGASSLAIWHFGWLFRKHADQARERVRALLKDPSYQPPLVTIKPITFGSKLGYWMEGVAYRRAKSRDGKKQKVFSGWKVNEEFEAYLFSTHKITAWTFPTRTRVPVALPKEVFEPANE